MSDVYFRLRKQTARLQGFLADLSDAQHPGTNWDEVINSTKTLGENVPVARWTLAEHFLTEWKSWSALLGRYLSYFGQPWEKIPESWKKLKSKCVALEQRLRTDESLGSLVAKSWRSEPGPTDVEADVRSLFHAVIASHERLMLLNTGNETATDWSDCDAVAKESDHRLREHVDRARGDVRRQALWHLRQYRHANLDVSWLDESRWRAAPSAFEYVLGATDREQSWIREVRSDLPSDLQPELATQIVRRITTAVTELGFESFAADVMSKEMIPTQTSPLGASAIEMLTINGHGGIADNPARIMVGVARQPHSLARTFRQLLAAFSARSELPSLGIVVSSCWDGLLFEQEFQTDFQSSYDDGHRLIFLLAGCPDTQLEPVPLSLGYQAMPRPEALPLSGRRVLVPQLATSNEGP